MDIIENVISNRDRFVAFNCKTEAAAKSLLQKLSDNGHIWVDGKSLLGNIFWRSYREKTCYNFSHSQFKNDKRLIVCDPIEYYQRDNRYKILDFNIHRMKHIAEGFLK